MMNIRKPKGSIYFKCFPKCLTKQISSKLIMNWQKSYKSSHLLNGMGEVIFATRQLTYILSSRKTRSNLYINCTDSLRVCCQICKWHWKKYTLNFVINEKGFAEKTIGTYRKLTSYHISVDFCRKLIIHLTGTTFKLDMLTTRL